MMFGAIIKNYGDSEVFELSNTLELPKINSNQVMVEIYSTSVNPIDLMKREGYGKIIFEKQRKLTFPWVLGSDFSGVVKKIGNKVTRFSAGDKVWGCTSDASHGTYAQYGVFDQAEIDFKPTGLSFNEAASLPYVALTTWAGLIRWAGLRPQDIMNKKVFVQAGAGGVGTFAIQLLKSWNCTVATTCSPQNHQLVKRLGADVAIDYSQEDFTKILKEYDIVLDSVGELGGAETIHRCTSVLKQQSSSHYITLNHSFMKTIEEKGLLLGVPHAIFLRQKTKREFKPINIHWSLFRPSLSGLQELGKLTSEGSVKPVIDSVYELKDISKAHDRVGTGHSCGKVVVEIRK
jgi:NADPH:quinone reductase-like Zn-dependent oxidoreductase